MPPMMKIREVEESPSDDSSPPSSDAGKEIMSILSASPQTPEALLQAREHLAQLPQDEDTQSLRRLEDTLSDILWEPARVSAKEGHVQLSEAALSCLDTLTSRVPSHSLSAQTLLRITAFSSPEDALSNTADANLSRALRPDDGKEKTTSFIVDTILQSYLRPLFSKATTKLTPAGRPSAYQDTTPLPDTRLNQETPAWKTEGPRAVAVFRWAVAKSDEKLIKDNWPLFTPVLLTLAEAEDPTTRLSGVQILATFIGKCPAATLHTTGIASLFEDAAFPSLLHLPSLTPEPESMRITTAAYAVLTGLAVKYEDAKSTSRRHLLDRVLRRGVLTAYDHASQYPGVVEVLMRTSATVVSLMGMHAIRHLQNLLFVISAVMNDPFMISHPSTVVEAAKALNACLTTCWPRLTANEQEQGRLIRIVSVCWLNLHDGDLSSRPSSGTQPELAEELKRTAQLISTLQETSESQVASEMPAIIAREPSLSQLFQA